MTDMAELTPNVKRLLLLRLSREAIPDGGGLIDGLLFFSDQEKRKSVLASSARWVRDAIATVRSASDPNPWRDADDETIAAEIMRRADDASGAGDGARRR